MMRRPCGATPFQPPGRPESAPMRALPAASSERRGAPKLRSAATTSSAVFVASQVLPSHETAVCDRVFAEVLAALPASAAPSRRHSGNGRRRRAAWRPLRVSERLTVAVHEVRAVGSLAFTRPPVRGRPRRRCRRAVDVDGGVSQSLRIGKSSCRARRRRRSRRNRRDDLARARRRSQAFLLVLEELPFGVVLVHVLVRRLAASTDAKSTSMPRHEDLPQARGLGTV